MLTQGQTEKLTLNSEKAFRDLENRIMSDVVARLQEVGASTQVTDWELSRLAQYGVSEKRIDKWVAEAMGISEKEAKRILSDTTFSEYTKQKRAYQIEGLTQVPFKENSQLQSLIKSVTLQTKGTFQNITGSMGFASKTAAGRMHYQSLRDFYTTTLDNAMLDIQTGAFDYNTVLERAINTMTSSGLRTIDYASGWSNRVEVAVRRALMTGFGQVQRFMSEQIASELGTEYFEVSAHGGARPEHAEWQGGIYTKDELETICGLGDPLGLCGINCYHSYDPFIPGVSVRRYSDEDLERLRQEDAEEHEWNGKSYNKYEALQEQRHMERQMRKYRRDAELLEQGGADDELIENKRIKYQTKFSQYKAFSKTMGLPMQRDRIYNNGLNLKTVAKSVKNGIIKARNISERRMANGLRTSPYHILSDEEIKSVKKAAKELNIPENILRFNQGNQTGFSDRKEIINIRGDILPDKSSNNLRDILSSKAVLAHEYYGHYKNHPSQFRVGDWRDEFRASYCAALNAPNLSDEERRMLMLDAYDRAREAGVSVRYNKKARRLIYGYDE